MPPSMQSGHATSPQHGRSASMEAEEHRRVVEQLLARIHRDVRRLSEELQTGPVSRATHGAPRCAAVPAPDAADAADPGTDPAEEMSSAIEAINQAGAAIMTELEESRGT